MHWEEEVLGLVLELRLQSVHAVFGHLVQQAVHREALRLV